VYLYFKTTSDAKIIKKLYKNTKIKGRRGERDERAKGRKDERRKG
jgi:hypothetical protein